MGLSQHKSPKSFTSLQVSERSETSAEITHLAREAMPYAFFRTISDVSCTFKRFHNLIFHQSVRWVYLGPGVKVGSLFGSARMSFTTRPIREHLCHYTSNQRTSLIHYTSNQRTSLIHYTSNQRTSLIHYTSN